MEKKYTPAMLEDLKTGQDREELGTVITYKRVPGCGDPGAVDPRVLKNSKKMHWMMKLMPKAKRENMFADLLGMRKMFNGVKSIPVTREDMRIEHIAIPGKGGDIPLRLYFPKGEAKGLPVLYYIHGGGFFAGTPDVVEQACKMITDMHPCITVSVDYRLAPENPYPAGHDDCWTTLQWIYGHIAEYGGDPDKVAVSGDSAGGNLCVYCARMDRDSGSPRLKLMIPYYPTVNMAGIEDEFFKKPTAADFELDDKYRKYVNPMMMGEATGSLGSILGDVDVNDPNLSPYGADVTGLPPALIIAGSHDFLSMESKAYGAKLHKAGIPVRVVIYRGMGHAFLDEVGLAPQAEDSLREVSRAMKEHVG